MCVPPRYRLYGFLSNSECTLRFHRLPVTIAESPGTNCLPSVNRCTVRFVYWWYTSLLLFHHLLSINEFLFSVFIYLQPIYTYGYVVGQPTRCLLERACFSVNTSSKYAPHLMTVVIKVFLIQCILSVTLYNILTISQPSSVTSWRWYNAPCSPGGYRPVSKINTQLKEGWYHKIMDYKTVPKLYLQMLHAAVGTGPHLIGANSMTIVNI
jgi:hypothetical protein